MSMPGGKGAATGRDGMQLGKAPDDAWPASCSTSSMSQSSNLCRSQDANTGVTSPISMTLAVINAGKKGHNFALQAWATKFRLVKPLGTANSLCSAARGVDLQSFRRCTVNRSCKHCLYYTSSCGIQMQAMQTGCCSMLQKGRREEEHGRACSGNATLQELQLECSWTAVACAG